jgi:glycerol-3-phosphate dehydrogenase subunit C
LLAGEKLCPHIKYWEAIMGNSNISYLPTDATCYDPGDDTYWDEAALQEEMTRAFEICHGCRMCFKFCDSFPNLFDFIDNHHDGDVRQIDAAQTETVMDACFQCKLCEVQCPYTPREKHEFHLDFPKIVHRYQAVEHKKHGTNFRGTILGDPDKSAKMARASMGAANLLNRVKAHRWLMEKAVGIHRDKLLPHFAASTFEKWAEDKGLTVETDEDTPHEAVLFQTCYVQNNEPEIGRDAIFVLQQNKVDAVCAKGLKCCGMPAWEQGDLDKLRQWAHHNLNVLMPLVEKGAKVLGLNPTCTMMMRQEWPELLEGADKERAKQLAEAVMDTSEFVWSIRKEERFNKDFKSTPGGDVAYHAPCHLRAQAKGFKGRDLLRIIPDVKPKLTMECCGHDGTYAMRVEGFESSIKIGKKAFDGMKEADAEIWATDCPLAALQFEQHAGVKPMHPMGILAKAYRSDGFSRSLETKGEKNEKSEA